MHHRLDGNRLAVARGPVVDDASLPGHLQPAIGVLGLEKVQMVVDQVLLHLGVQNNGIPRGLHDALVQFGTLGPVAAVIDPNLFMERAGPFPGGKDKGLGMMLVTGQEIGICVAAESRGAI